MQRLRTIPSFLKISYRIKTIESLEHTFLSKEFLQFPRNSSCHQKIHLNSQMTDAFHGCFPLRAKHTLHQVGIFHLGQEIYHSKPCIRLQRVCEWCTTNPLINCAGPQRVSPPLSCLSPPLTPVQIVLVARYIYILCVHGSCGPFNESRTDC